MLCLFSAIPALKYAQVGTPSAPIGTRYIIKRNKPAPRTIARVGNKVVSLLSGKTYTSESTFQQSFHPDIENLQDLLLQDQTAGTRPNPRSLCTPQKPFVRFGE